MEYFVHTRKLISILLNNTGLIMLANVGGEIED